MLVNCIHDNQKSYSELPVCEDRRLFFLTGIIIVLIILNVFFFVVSKKLLTFAPVKMIATLSCFGQQSNARSYRQGLF